MRWVVFPMIESWWPRSRVIRRRSSWPRVSTFIFWRQVFASKHREANQIKQSRACTHALPCCGAMDITCIPMARGFVHLAAVVGWFTRRVLAWRVSMTLETAFCAEAVEEVLAKPGAPRSSTWSMVAPPVRAAMRRQGNQFTSSDFVKVLAAREIKISMDGKRAWRDNVFVERLWRTIKYEEVYLQAYARVPQARTSIGRCLGFHKSRRPHSSRDGQTPDQVYFNLPMPEATAAQWRRKST